METARDSRNVLVSGKLVAYEVIEGDGPGYFFAHGIAASSDNWYDLPEKIAEATGQRVVVIDFPGHGKSPANKGFQGADDFLAAMQAVLGQENMGAPHLVGHSLGGGICLMQSALNPGSYSSLTLSAPGGLGKEANHALKAGLIPGAGLGARLMFNKASLRGVHVLDSMLDTVGLHPYIFSDSALDVFEDLTDSSHREAFLETLREVIRPSGQALTALSHLSLIDGAKTQIIWAEHDPVLPISHGHHAHSQMPGSSFHVFPGHSHEPHNLDREHFLELVLEISNLEEVKEEAKVRKSPAAPARSDFVRSYPGKSKKPQFKL